MNARLCQVACKFYAKILKLSMYNNANVAFYLSEAKLQLKGGGRGCNSDILLLVNVTFCKQLSN